MKCNVGKLDRIARVIIGLAMLAAGYTFQSWWGAVGIIPIFTAIVRWCPAYVPLGVSSCNEE